MFSASLQAILHVGVSRVVVCGCCHDGLDVRLTLWTSASVGQVLVVHVERIRRQVGPEPGVRHDARHLDALIAVWVQQLTQKVLALCRA